MQRDSERNFLKNWTRHHGLVSEGALAAPAWHAGDLRVLWVGDDYDPCCELDRYFADKGYVLDRAENLAKAKRLLQATCYELVLVDLDLPDGNGLSLIRDTHRRQAREFVVVTGHGSVKTVVEALRYQVFDYLTKPVEPAALDSLLARIGDAGAAPVRIGPNAVAASSLPIAAGADGTLLVGDSEAMRGVQNLLVRAASTDITVLLQGESGTGKEVAARLLHRLSHRASGPFVAYNCAAVSPLLIASELFGHERGSFTGALRTHKGIFERAEGGTLFLDEVTEMPPDLQTSLLRVLETGTVTRVGGDRERPIDVRIVAATNRDPLQSVREGKLRLDLLYRLQVFPVTMPTLRSRPQDIAPLSRHFLSQFSTHDGGARTVSSAAASWLQNQTWPGNVRELRNVLQRACLLSGQTIELEHLLPPARGPAAQPPPEQAQLAAHPGPVVGAKWRDAEREIVLQALADCGGNRNRAAVKLGISPKTIYNKLKRFDGDRSLVSGARFQDESSGTSNTMM